MRYIFIKKHFCLPVGQMAQPALEENIHVCKDRAIRGPLKKKLNKTKQKNKSKPKKNFTKTSWPTRYKTFCLHRLGLLNTHSSISFSPSTSKDTGIPPSFTLSSTWMWLWTKWTKLRKSFDFWNFNITLIQTTSLSFCIVIDLQYDRQKKETFKGIIPSVVHLHWCYFHWKTALPIFCTS